MCCLELKRVIGADNFFQDTVSFGSPDERFGILIMLRNVSFNGAINCGALHRQVSNMLVSKGET